MTERIGDIEKQGQSMISGKLNKLFRGESTFAHFSENIAQAEDVVRALDPLIPNLKSAKVTDDCTATKIDHGRHSTLVFNWHEPNVFRTGIVYDWQTLEVVQILTSKRRNFRIKIPSILSRKLNQGQPGPLYLVVPVYRDVAVWNRGGIKRWFL